jgi:TldD protein
LAGAAVTIVDDPSLSAGFGSYGVDDEGEPAHRRVLVDAGIQIAELTDAAAATKLGVGRSANGRRESYAHVPIPRMSNTYFDVGTESAPAIIGDVADGVYVARLSAGEVDTATGDFTFSASAAREISGGQLGRPLRGVTLIGNCFEALAAIDAVAGDLAFTQAMCGKEGQWVPVSYGSPTMRVGALTVTGH